MRDDTRQPATLAAGHTATSTRCTAPTPRCATCTRSSRSSRSGTTTRCRTTTRAPRPAAGWTRRRTTRAARRRPPTGRSSRRCRTSRQGASRIYRGLNFGKTVDLIMLDQRQYRGDQPCGDAFAPACAEFEQAAPVPRDRADGLGQAAAAESQAAWKVIGNEVMIMNTKVRPGHLLRFDSWQGYHARARGAAGAHPVQRDQGRRLRHRRHPHVHRRRRAHPDGRRPAVALEFVGGSITSAGLGETDLDAGDGVVIKGNDQNPNTRPR